MVDVNAYASKESAFATPLICASKFDSPEACRLLIKRGAHVEKKNCSGQSPLHYASRKGHARVLEVSHKSELSFFALKDLTEKLTIPSR